MLVMNAIKENIARAYTDGGRPDSVLTADDVFSAVAENGVFIDQLNDLEGRGSTVPFQAVGEATMTELKQSGLILSMRGSIHTKKKPTPLIINGKITPGIITEPIADDPVRLASVTSRPQIMRDYLAVGGELRAIYPNDPKNSIAITDEQHEIYEVVKAEFPQHLIDLPIQRAIGEDFVGATYVAKLENGSHFAFAIKARQAWEADEEKITEWGVWGGNPDENSAVAQRVVDVDREFPEAGLIEFMNF